METDNSKIKPPQKSMIIEERLELAEKIEVEFDEFINSLEKRRYTEGWSEEKWQEEFDKHPLFVTKTPVENEEVSPLVEGLQKLKYDPKENTPEGLALAYKDDGNFNFKYKKYRMAIIAYTEGLKAKCDNSEINAALYNNRAASHFFLKNYHSALNDCEKAIQLKPDYKKAIVRAAQCLFHLSKYNRCVKRCNDILKNDPKNKDILELRKKAVSASAKRQADRDAKIKEARAKEHRKEEMTLLSEIKKRGIQVANSQVTKIWDLEMEPEFSGCVQNRVHLSQDNCLVWPVIFLYPEYDEMDCVQKFKETTTFREYLAEKFSSPREWDKQGKYKLENLNFYFENRHKKLAVKINLDSTLGDALKHKEYIAEGFGPMFMGFVRNSAAEKKYLEDF